MMFMIPTPPTTNEIVETTSNKPLIREVVDDSMLIISAMSRHTEVVLIPFANAMPLA